MCVRGMTIHANDSDKNDGKCQRQHFPSAEEKKKWKPFMASASLGSVVVVNACARAQICCHIWPFHYFTFSADHLATVCHNKSCRGRRHTSARGNAKTHRRWSIFHFWLTLLLTVRSRCCCRRRRRRLRVTLQNKLSRFQQASLSARVPIQLTKSPSFSLLDILCVCVPLHLLCALNVYAPSVGK